jgi:uncharacterized protein YjbI with pentapeptide repeats
MVTSASAAPSSAEAPAAAKEAGAAAPDPAKAAAELGLTEAQLAKTKAETRKLEHDDKTLWRLLSSLGPLLTALVAVGGLLFTVKKALNDRRDTAEREARQRSETEATAETTRFDERFVKAAAGLSSVNPGEKSGAAVLVASMVRDKQANLSDQALQLLLVTLQTPQDSACERLLRGALERFAHVAPGRLVADANGEPTAGLSHLQTSYLKLPHLELPGLDLAFSVLRKAEFRNAGLAGSQAYEATLEESDFRAADLTKAQWVKAKAPRARFQNAVLARARLRLADLGGANFFRADLTRANLRQANLKGAKFDRATLSRADFHGAELDDEALKTILTSEDWEAAEFDAATLERLRELETQPGE